MANEKTSGATEENPAATGIDTALVRERRLSDRPLDLGLPPRAERIALARKYPGLLLAELLDGTTPEHRHPEIDFGLPAGREFPNEED